MAFSKVWFDLSIEVLGLLATLNFHQLAWVSVA